MRDEEKSRPQLISELVEFRGLVEELSTWKKSAKPLIDKLSLSEAKFRALTEKSAFGILLIQDGLAQYANPRVAEMFGYGRDEFAALKEVRALVSHEDWPLVEARLTGNVSDETEPSCYRFRGIRKDGGMIYCSGQVSSTRHDKRPAIILSIVEASSLIDGRAGLDSELKKYGALYDLAVEITADRSLEENLSLLVEKSRLALGADTSFIAMIDEQAQNLVMQFCSGIKTAAFRNLRMPLGDGPARGAPNSSEGQMCDDYFGDLEPSLRGVIADEGLVSGIAAPIQIRGTNLGVLHAFNRTRRTFSRADIEILSLLGNLAAVEIVRKRAEKERVESEERYRSVMEAVPDPIVVYIAGKVAYVNPAFTRVFGWALEELSSGGPDEAVGIDRVDSRQMIDQVIPGEGYYGFETRRRNKAGDLIDINVSAALLRGSDGNVIGSVITLQDITERRRAEQELQKYKEQLEELVRQRTDEAAQLAEANKKLSLAVKEQEQRAFELTLLHQMGELLQACRTEKETFKIVGSICSQLFANDTGFLSILDESRTSLQIVASWGAPASDATDLPFENCWALRLGKMHIVENPEVELVCPHVGLSRDFNSICTPVTAQGEVLGMMHLCWATSAGETDEAEVGRKLESRRMLVIRLVEHYALSLVNLRLRQTLTRQSIRDQLTGLFNRRYMEESLEREVRRAERRGTSLGIIMLDVDHFKNFNDLYGHEAGDVILRRLGAFLRRSVRGEDIACRYGGEECTLILPDAAIDAVVRRAETIREAAKEALRINQQGKILGVTISLGVAAYPDHGNTAEEALNAADQALLRAKAEGRDKVVRAESPGIPEAKQAEPPLM